MKLDEVVAWYQKKIGTYDKQQWEKTVEQRILNGFTQVPVPNTKFRTEYIDVDLVRGSSFPKAKSKQSLLTVIRLATYRFLFLPLYAKWWVEQISPRIYSFLLLLYGLQLFNWAIYSYNVNRVVRPAMAILADTENPVGLDHKDEQIVSFMDLLIPFCLSLLLSIIHSQIVATASGNHAGDQRQRLLQPKHRRRRERSQKRRKKLRSRNVPTTMGDIVTQQPKDMTSGTIVSDAFYVAKMYDRHYPSDHAVEQDKDGPDEMLCNISKSKEELRFKEPSIISSILTKNNCKFSSKTKCDDGEVGNDSEVPNGQLDETIKTQQVCPSMIEPVSELRRRNVNWNYPIKSKTYLNRNLQAGANIGTNEQTNYSYLNSSTLDCSTDQSDRLNDSPLEDNSPRHETTTNEQRGTSYQTNGDDDGFESLNGKSSSGEENAQATKTSRTYSSELVQNETERDTRDDHKNGQNIDTDANPAKPHTLHLKSVEFQNQVSTKFESSDTDEDGDDIELLSPPAINPHFTEATTSATEWIGITTNSEECSYSSGDIANNSDSQIECSDDLEYDYFTPTVILNPTCGIGDRISCTIWDGREAKKAEMSVLDISSAIIERVEAMPETCDYVYIGVAFSVILSFVPAFCRLCEAVINLSESAEIHFFDLPALVMEKTSFSYRQILLLAFSNSAWQNSILVVDFFLRLFLTFLFFFLLAVAERTFKQRFLYAKLFSHLTSSRRARKSELPHFRLNKVRNIKTWLSVRSYLKRRGPQRSVDVIVSAAFMLTLLLLAFLSVEWLKDSVQLQSQHTLEALIWSCALGCFILRFMTLGTKINRKYRSISVLITEQINLYLQIEQKPHNKEELMVSNSVLKLAADLLKELESPFKISGLSANPYLYTTIKVVILSALSGVLSEMLGFKLKLHKIKIK